jgi:3-oxoacyl-[acyl-carrier protein] reductase
MKNKTALVTGGAKGIGAAICRELANMGYNLAVNYNSSYEAAQSLKSELSQLVDVDIYKADVSDSTQVADMLDNIKKDFGGVDVLVNNAGIAQQALFTDITDEMWQRMIGTNLTGTFNCCRSVLPYMINQKNGVIINITSMWGQVGASMEVHYSAAKSGVIGLTKALAKEVGLSGIRVNAVSPGVVLTDMMAQFTDDDKNALKDETPINRLGTPEDIAHTVAFLCSDKADFITGQVIPVNGGFVI